MKKIITFSILILILPLISALKFEVQSEHAVYFTNEAILITATVENEHNSLQRVSVSGFLGYSEDNSTIESFERGLMLAPNETLDMTIKKLTVLDDLKKTNYIVNLKAKTDSETVERTIYFDVADSPISLGLRLMSCADLYCTKEQSTFNKGDSIYLEYDSPSDDVKGTVTYPDNTKKEISLPRKITLDQAGTYTVEAVARKSRFKPSKSSIEIIATGSIAPKKSTSACNYDGICDPSETTSNCPDDCKEGILPNIELPIIYVVISVVMLIILVFVIVYSLKKRKLAMEKLELIEETEDEEPTDRKIA